MKRLAGLIASYNPVNLENPDSDKRKRNLLAVAPVAAGENRNRRLSVTTRSQFIL